MEGNILFSFKRPKNILFSIKKAKNIPTWPAKGEGGGKCPLLPFPADAHVLAAKFAHPSVVLNLARNRFEHNVVFVVVRNQDSICL